MKLKSNTLSGLLVLPNQRSQHHLQHPRSPHHHQHLHQSLCKCKRNILTRIFYCKTLFFAVHGETDINLSRWDQLLDGRNVSFKFISGFVLNCSETSSRVPSAKYKMKTSFLLVTIPRTGLSMTTSPRPEAPQDCPTPPSR